MLRDVPILQRFLAVWSATAEACADHAIWLFLGLFRVPRAIPLFATWLHDFDLQLTHVAAFGVDLIRRAARELADSVQPRAPPVAV